jgi:uncharacterized membrane protein
MEKSVHLLFFLFFLAIPTYAAGIAISPSRLQFELYKGETAESALTIINPGGQEIGFSLSTDEYRDWFSFSESDGFLQPGENRLIRIRVSPPADIPNGEYSTLLTLSFENADGLGQLSLNLATSMKTKIIVTGKQLVSLLVTDLKAEDTEQGLPLTIRLGLSNRDKASRDFARRQLRPASQPQHSQS